MFFSFQDIKGVVLIIVLLHIKSFLSGYFYNFKGFWKPLLFNNMWYALMWLSFCVLLGVCWVSYDCGLMFLTHMRKVWPLILTVFCLPFALLRLGLLFHVYYTSWYSIGIVFNRSLRFYFFLWLIIIFFLVSTTASFYITISSKLLLNFFPHVHHF